MTPPLPAYHEEISAWIRWQYERSGGQEVFIDDYAVLRHGAQMFAAEQVTPNDGLKPRPALRDVYERLEDSSVRLENAPEVYIIGPLGRDLADLLREFPAVPKEVKEAIESAQQCAAARDLDGARNKVWTAMAACRAWEGVDPDIVLLYPLQGEGTDAIRRV